MRITLNIKDSFEDNILTSWNIILIINEEWIIVKKELEIQQTKWMTYDRGYIITWEPKKVTETIWTIEFSEIKKITNLFK